MEVWASDDFGVAEVRLFVNGVLAGTETTGQNGSYAFSWDSTQTADGTVRLSATATDHAGNQGTSANVELTVANASRDTQPPSVEISSPQDGAAVSGRVSLVASGSDNQQMGSVSIYAAGKLRCAGTSSVSCEWNTRKEPAGWTTVEAVAVDAAGNSTSASVNVEITSGGKSGGGNDKPNPGKGKNK